MHDKSQFALDYLVIIGLGMVALVTASYVLYIFSFGSSIDANHNALSTISAQLVGSVRSVYSQGNGAQDSLFMNFPQINANKSFFCGNFFVITSQSGSYSESTDANLSGILPTNSGLDEVLVKNQIADGKGTVNIGLVRRIAFINFQSKISGDTLSYNLSFSNSTGSLLTGITFRLDLSTETGSLLNSTIGTASGIATGSISSTTPPPYLVQIYPSGYSEVFSECV